VTTRRRKNSDHKKTVAKSRAADDEVATITLSGEALRRATVFGDGDPSKGVDLIMRSVADVSVLVDGELIEYPASAWTERDPAETNTIASGLGAEADQRIDEVLVAVRRLIAEGETVYSHEAISPIAIGRHLGIKIAIRGLSITIDLSHLVGSMLEVADEIFSDAFGTIVVFTGDSLLRGAVNLSVAGSVYRISELALETLADYYSETVIRGAASAAESFGENVARKFNRALTQSERKSFRELARKYALSRLSTRIPHVGRGGTNRTADGMPESTLLAFHQETERVYPFWKYAQQRYARGDETWQADARTAPEYHSFTAKDKRHAGVVLALIQTGRKVNGALPEPRVLAREHARLIAGLAATSDSKFRRYAKLGKQLSLRGKAG
jgi:hypothetical protein